MLPFILAGAAIAGAISLFSDDSGSGGGSSSNEGDTRREYARNKRAQINQDIQNFAQQSTQNMQSKYNAHIEIDGISVNVVKKDSQIKNMINKKIDGISDLELVIKRLHKDSV